MKFNLIVIAGAILCFNFISEYSCEKGSFVLFSDQNRNENTRIPVLPSATLDDSETSSNDEETMKSNAHPVQTKNKRQVFCSIYKGTWSYFQ